MTINLRDALIIAAVLLAAVFFGLWRHAASQLDDERARTSHYRASATHNAERLLEAISKHNALVDSLKVERAASKAAADRVARLREDLQSRITENAALRAQIMRDRPDVQDYYAQPVPRPAAELLLHAASPEDRVP